jgi:urease accessory protein UreF
MRLDRPTPLPAASFLQLMWLASPALPVGGFSYSEGLESAIENAGLASEAAVGDWLLDQLHITQARGDMALIAKAVGAWRRGDLEHVKELNDWVLHTRETSELRLQTEQMGRSLAEWLRIKQGLTEREANRRAYGLAKHIQQHGTRAKPFFKPAFDKNESRLLAMLREGAAAAV